MRFMLTATWKQPPNEQVMALVPAEEARVRELEEEGIHESLYLAADQSTVWGIWNCASQEQLEETLHTLPLYEHLNIDISPLADEDQ